MWIGLGIRITNWWRRLANGPFNNHATLTNGLVSYWKLDEQSGVRYDSVVASANDLTDNNTVTYVNAGPDEVVANFVAANNEYLSVTTPATLKKGFPRSLAFWYYNTGDGSTTGIAQCDNTPTHDTPIWLFQKSTTAVRAYGGRNVGFWAATGTISTGWHMLVITQTTVGGNATKFYCDGVQVGITNTAAIDDPADVDTTIYIGSAFSGASTTELARFGAWTTDISAATILSLYNSGTGKLYSDLTTAEKVGLVSYWNLDEASGVRYDSHGANDLTDNNTVLSATNAVPPPKNIAAYFTAANSEKLNRANVNFGFTNFSIALWAKTPVAASTYQEYVSKGNTVNFDLRSYDANYVQFNVNGSSAQIQTDTNWHLIIAYYIHSEKKAYLTIDAGTPTVGAAGSGLSETASELALGAATSLYFNNGLMDEVGIWSRVLTAQERTDLYNSGAGLFYGS